MEDMLSLEHEVVRKRLQLDALLDIAQAINNDVSEEGLYKIFNFTLRSNLHITRLALFVWEADWEFKVGFGARFVARPAHSYYRDISVPQPVPPDESGALRQFDLVIPVAQENKTLALVFIGHVLQDTFGQEDVRFIQAISNVVIVAVENKKLARQQLQQEALRKELEIAGSVQHQLFPKQLPRTKALEIEASYFPHDSVGGDYYDYVPIDQDRFFICIADVSGKGVPAAIMMSNFQASLRALLRQDISLRRIVIELNRQALESTEGEQFITFFSAIYDRKQQKLRYINSGHNPPLLYANESRETLLEKGSPVLGVAHPLPFLREGVLSDLNSFLLFAYTDGLTETTNDQGEQFGVDLLIAYLRRNRQKSLKKIHQDVVAMLDNFRGRNAYQDDITMLSCRVIN